ncbi:MAG: hypothetical protein VKP62_00015 [Candidatus Sericytochromatia bacterium]|nr:hypothetical protein [Candidatus Sericytochromatia bacterium]
MPAPRLKPASIICILAASLLACQAERQPIGVTLTPLALGPAATASSQDAQGGASPAAATSNAKGSEPSSDNPNSPNHAQSPTSPQRVVHFREDFSGSAIDGTSWSVHEKSGVVRLKDGWLNVMQVVGEADFPLLVSSEKVIPKSGPWYFESKAQWLSAVNESIASSLNWDVLPPSGPADPGFVPPTVEVRNYWYKPTVTVRTGSKEVTGQLDDTSQEPFVIRLEFDGKSDYQVLVNSKIVVSEQMTRRPRYFWIGRYPNVPVPGARFHNWRVDYIETGPLEQLTRAPSPSPSPSEGSN